MGFGQKGQPRDTLRFKPVGNQVQESGASTLRCCRDGGPEKGFVIELCGIAVIKLENAVFAHHVGGTEVGIGAWGEGARSSGPSRVGVEAGLGHRIQSDSTPS